MQEQVHLPKINGLQYGRYLWKKEWVRPYESIYSIMHTFCSVNVVTGNQAFNLLFNCLKTYYKSIFVRDWLCYAQSQMIEYQYAFLRELTPDWYISEIEQFPTIKYRGLSREEKNGSEIAFHKRLRVCPLCMKEHYHSYFHNITGVETCFIHDVPLETQDCKYDISAIICNSKADDTFDNAYYGIIPPDRKVDNEAYDKNPVHCSFDTIYPILIPRQEEANPSMWHLLSGDRKADQVIHVPQCDESGEQFCNNLVEEYGSYKLPLSVWNDDPYCVGNKPELNSSFLEILPWTREIFIRSIFGKITAEEKYRFWEYNNMLYNEHSAPGSDLMALKLCFIWAYVDTNEPCDALSFRKLIYPNAACNRGRFCRIGIEDSLEGFYNQYEEYWRKLDTTKVNVKIAIQRDYITYLFDLFVKRYKGNEKINSKKWMDEIEYPCYYILNKEDEEGYTIYRYNNS